MQIIGSNFGVRIADMLRISELLAMKLVMKRKKASYQAREINSSKRERLCSATLIPFIHTNIRKSVQTDQWICDIWFNLFFL